MNQAFSSIFRYTKANSYEVGLGVTAMYTYWRGLSVIGHEDLELQAMASMPLIYGSFLSGLMWPISLPFLITHHIHSKLYAEKPKRL